MKCPLCASIDLVLSERQGVEIDYCPKCRGVWLDRGELDKLIERSFSHSTTGAIAEHRHRQDSRTGHHHEHQEKGHYKHKSWLSELFD